MAQLPVKATPQGDIIFAAQARQPNTSRWDTFLLGDADAATAIPNPIQFFRVPLNNAGSGFPAGFLKTWAETNMRVASQLEYPVAGTVNQVTVSLIPVISQGDAMARRLIALLQDSIVRVTVDDVVEYEEHLVQLGGTGLTGIPEMNGAADELLVSAAPFVRGVDKLRPAIPIPSRSRFGVDIIPNTNNGLLATVLAGQQIAIKVHLTGVFSRAIDA